MPQPLDTSSPFGREISVVIPAYNEAARIRGTLETVLAYLEARFDEHEVIVVDDGSADGTAAEVEAAAEERARRGDARLATAAGAARPPGPDLAGRAEGGAPDVAPSPSTPSIRCLRNRVNSGKGFSVRRGILEASHDPVLFTDADLSTPIEETEKLLAALRDGYDLAIGSRRMAGSDVRRSAVRRLLGWGFAQLAAVLAVRGFHDTQCGFKMFRRAAAARIFPFQTIERWGFDVEILAIARRQGLTVAEVPVRWRQSGDSRVRLRTPLQMGMELLRIRANDLRGRYGRRPQA